MKRVLITGVSGFVGRHLCLHLRHKRFQVIGSDLGSFPPILRNNFKCFPADICDADQVFDLVQKSKPDVVVHLAAQSIPQLSWREPEKTFRVNVTGTLHLLNAIRQNAPAARILFTSSHQVYGRTFRDNVIVHEDDLLYPENPYAVSKALAELACLNFHAQFGSQVMIARVSNHVGKGQSPYFAFSDWCRQVAESELRRRKSVLEVGSLEVERDFLHIQDVLRAYEILILHGVPGEVYNVCSGKAQKIRSYVDYLLKLAKVPIKVKVKKSRVRVADVKRTCASPSKIRRLGWRPRNSAYAAIDDLLQEWREKLGLS